MTVEELGKKAILILGFGTEGQATYEYLRKKWPDKLLSIADRQTAGEFSEAIAYRIQSDPAVMLNLGPRYLDSLDPYQCEVIIKTPGIPATIVPIVRARKTGCILTSHSQIFLSNYPKDKIIGVTGTKGKSMPARPIQTITKQERIPVNRGATLGKPPPPL